MSYGQQNGCRGEGCVHKPPCPRPERRLAAKSGHKRCRKYSPHGEYAPDGKQGRGSEEKGVQRVGRTCDPKSHDMEDHRSDHRPAKTTMHASTVLRRQPWQIASRQQGLKEKKDQRKNAREGGGDIDRTAPCQQGTRCGRRYRHHDDSP